MSAFDLDDFAQDYKRINKQFLERQPRKAVKGVISGGKVVKFKEKDGSERPTPVLLVTSPVGTWEGEMEFGLGTKVNQAVLKSAYGSTSSGWIGKEVGFYIDPAVTNPNGQVVGGIRIKTFAPDPFADDTQPATQQQVAVSAVGTTAAGDDIPF